MTDNLVLLRDLAPGQRKINTMFIVLDIGKPSQTKDQLHEIRSVRVADRSGSMLMSAWDETGSLLQPSDICRLSNGYTNIFKGSLQLYVGKGSLQKVGEFCFVFQELPNFSDPNYEPTKEHLNRVKAPDTPGANSSRSAQSKRDPVQPPASSHGQQSQQQPSQYRPQLPAAQQQNRGGWHGQQPR